MFCAFRWSDVGIVPPDHDNQHRLDESFPTVLEFLKMAFCGNSYAQIAVLGVKKLELGLGTIIISTAMVDLYIFAFIEIEKGLMWSKL